MRRISYTSPCKKSTLIYLLACVIAAGIITGAVYQARLSPSPSAMIHQYSAPVYGCPVAGYTIKGFLMNALLLFITFVLGFFALGQPFGLLLLFYKGFGTGAAAAILYSSYGTKALAKMMLLTLPKALGLYTIFILAVRELIRASGYTLACWYGNECSDEKSPALKLYILKYLVLVFIAMLISACDAAANLLFVRLS